MIRISVDQAYAYDMLAIHVVKQRAFNGAAAEEARLKLSEEIRDAVGAEVHEAVLLSREYQELIDVNQTIFNAVDQIKELSRDGGHLVMDAGYIDDRNYRRHQLKAALQERFFSEALSERKIGYQ